jgi:membrane protein implicated in regulation of membrane protease activity
MSKKSNTLFFILGATIFNVVITLGSFVLLLVLYAKFLAPVLPSDAAGWGFPLIFLGSIAISFFLYRTVLKRFLKRVKVEEHFDPLFSSRRPWKRN